MQTTTLAMACRDALWSEPRLPLSHHAKRRMAQRGIGLDSVHATMRHGRCVHVRGADIYAIGRRECRRAERVGLDLWRHEGVHVVCAADGTALTVYRNHELSLRDSSRSRRVLQRAA